MHKHIDEKCKMITHERLTSTYKEANALLSKFSNLMNEGESKFIENWIATRRIPTPRLLIKDHKQREDDGNFPTRLLIPATNFTQCFAKISFLAIKSIFDANDINPMKRTIVQSSHLKVQLEQLNLKADGCTIASLDIINMYPSIKHRLIRQAINHYCADINEEEQEVIDAALEMQQFSMGNTIITFRDKYYEYGVSEDPMERGLTIGGYDSAWLADMVAGYLLDLAENHFEMTTFFGMYRDDGNVVFDGIRSADELKTWLAEFQAKVNSDVGGNDIEFTMDIWKPGEESKTIVPKILNVIGAERFPYLDMEMRFDGNQDL